MLQYGKILTEVRDLLSNSAGENWSQTAKTFLTSNDPKGFPKFEQQMKTQLEEMRKTGAVTDAASLLEQPLSNVRAMLTIENREQIDKEWSEKLYVSAHRLEQDYPFVESSGEASLPDLTKFLNPVDGQLWDFYKRNLEASFTEVGSGQLKPREGSKIKFSEAFVSYLNNARHLRDALFANGGKSPGFNFGVTLQTSVGSSVLIDLQVEGNHVQPGAAQSAKWTGSGGAMITVSQGSGTPAQKPFPGNWWSLFRMVEQGGATKTSDNQYALSWRVGSTVVSARLQPPSPVNNPFDLRLFRELRAPQNTK